MPCATAQTARHGTERSALARPGTPCTEGRTFPLVRTRISSGAPLVPLSREIYTYLSTYKTEMTSVLPLGCTSPALPNVLNTSSRLILNLIRVLSDSRFSQLKSYYGWDVVSHPRHSSTKAQFLYVSIIIILAGYGSRNGEFV